MKRIIISEFMDQPAVDWLREQGFDVAYDPGLVDRPEDLAAALEAEAAGLIVRNRTQVRGRLLDAGRTLEVVGRLGVGLDNIDLETCKTRGIAVLPATGGNTVSVAEYVITAMLILRRRAWFGTADVTAGRWPRQKMIGQEVMGTTLGLVGFGEIAQAVAQRARAFGIKVLAHDPFLPKDEPAWQHADRQDTLDDMLAVSDYVSLHVPLTPETRNLVNAARIAALKESAILINTARGGVVDETAVAEALHSGRLGGAALDVFAEEPLPAGSPLDGAPNLIATPHVAGVTEQSNTRISWLIARVVAGHLS